MRRPDATKRYPSCPPADQPNTAQPPAGYAPTAGGHLDTQPAQQLSALAERQAQPVVQPGHPRLGHRADLGAGRPDGIGSLIRVTPLHSLAALAAAPDADAEAGDHWCRGGRQIGLVLLDVTLVIDHPPAVGTAARKGGVELPVDARRGHAMAVATVLGSRPAPRTLRFDAGLSLRERRRLALTGTARLLKELLQLGDASIPRFQRCNQLGKPGRLRFRRPAQRRDLSCQRRYSRSRITRGTVTSRNSPSYAPPPNRWWTPLYKYLRGTFRVTLGHSA